MSKKTVDIRLDCPTCIHSDTCSLYQEKRKAKEITFECENRTYEAPDKRFLRLAKKKEITDNIEILHRLVMSVFTELPHFKLAITSLESQGLSSGTLPDIYKDMIHHLLCCFPEKDRKEISQELNLL